MGCEEQAHDAKCTRPSLSVEGLAYRLHSAHFNLLNMLTDKVYSYTLLRSSGHWPHLRKLSSETVYVLI